MSGTLDNAPIRTHITGSDIPLGGGCDRKPPGPVQLVITVKTVVLTSQNPYSDLVNLDPAREYMLLQVFGNDAVLCTSLSQAQSPANVASGLPAPDGALLATGQVIPIRGINRMWVAAAAYPTQVSVILAHRAP